MKRGFRVMSKQMLPWDSVQMNARKALKGNARCVRSVMAAPVQEGLLAREAKAPERHL